MGQGALDQYDEHYMGMVGMHGTKAANFCVTESDLLIVIGGRFSDRWTGNTAKFGGGAKLLQIDIDDAEVNKNVRVMAQVTGDARTVLRKLIARMDPVRHEEWFEHAERMTDMYPLSYNKELLTGPWAGPWASDWVQLSEPRRRIRIRSSSMWRETDASA